MELNSHKTNYKKDIAQYENDGNCVVCLEDLTENEQVSKIFKCGHIFHEQCLFDWIKRNLREPKCPHCN